ncbi:MAG: hypothetical protein EB101_12680 [Chitinophagia bacterium]|jgi:hypothetical protein|nr:hypothetical protein [Chitinophagia bacterium]
MKKQLLLSVFLGMALWLFRCPAAMAQCSICTKTAQQLGEGPAEGMNTGILYLAFAPFAIIGYIGYRWYKANRN